MKALCLVITALVFLISSYRESQRRGMKRWWVYVVATLAVGPSFPFPLFLCFRQARPDMRMAQTGKP